MLGIEISGGSTLCRALDRCAREAERRVEAWLHALGSDIAEDAAARVRRQRDPDRPLPSRLAESIVVEGEGDAVFVRACAPYAVFVELGTARMAAEPFLQPAFDDALAELARYPVIAAMPRRKP